MINIGDTAPGFSLSDQHGCMQCLSDLLSQGSLMLYFYPADFTPICTAQACEFRDAFKTLASMGMNTIGISPQSVESHRQFAEAQRIPFPLLADEDKRVIKSFGVQGPLGLGVRRATFLINTEGVVIQRVVADILLSRHKKMIKEALAAH